MKLEIAILRAGHSIRRLHQISQALFLQCAGEHGLTPVQYSTLNAIVEVGDTDQSTLSRLIALDPTNLVQVLDRLTAKSLITRTRGVDDRRRQVLKATQEGKDLIRHIDPLLVTSQEMLLKPLNAEEQETFLSLLNRLVRENNIYSRAPHDASLVEMVQNNGRGKTAGRSAAKPVT